MSRFRQEQHTQSTSDNILRQMLSRLLLAVCVLASAVAAQAQESTEASRPRVGLVLSGGGARGSAHVGVLKVLEQLQVPIDAVAGTSMGALVGGL
jgi:NTE family protein